MIAELSDPDTEETEPTLTEDELEIYFASTRMAGRRQIFVSTRSTRSDRWAVPALVDELVSSTGVNYSPEIARDGLTLWFVSDRPGGRGDVDIYVSKRTARGAAWSTPENATDLDTASCEIDPGPLPERDQMVVTRCDGIGHNHLNLTQRLGPDAPWDPVVYLDQLNTDEKEGDPAFANHGLSLYFATTRDSPNHDNRADIWRTTRASTDAPFEAPVPVLELNILEVDDQDPWVSDDERHIVFTSARDRWPREIYESFR
jgi:Tol biopolymer transport system component